MSNMALYPCQFRVYSIRCGDASPTHCNVVFEIKCEKFTLPMFVSFSFTSFDMMTIHLKNLARTYNICSVDHIFTSYFPATLTLEEHFNAPAVFRKLSFKSNLTWPARDSFGVILLD